MRSRGTGRVFQQAYKAKDGTRRHTETWGLKYYNRRLKDHDYEYGFPSEADAEKRLRQLLAEQDRGVLAGRALDRLTFDELWPMIVADYKANDKKSLNRVEDHIEHLKRWFGGMRCIEITTDRVEAYRAARREEGVENSTINRELTTLKGMFTLATQAKRFSKDAVPHIPIVQEDNVREGFFEAPQFESVLRHMKPRHRRVITVAYITGWRTASEILTRQWQHVDFDAGWLRIDPGRGTKNRDGRMFPLDIDPRLRKVLEEAQAAAERLKRKKGIVPLWVFTSENGRRRMRSFYTEWRKACRKAGVPGKLIHDFRRTACRNLVRAGVSEVAIMKMVGLKTNSIFRRYAIVDETMLREAAAKVRLAIDRRAAK